MVKYNNYEINFVCFRNQFLTKVQINEFFRPALKTTTISNLKSSFQSHGCWTAKSSLTGKKERFMDFAAENVLPNSP